MSDTINEAAQSYAYEALGDMGRPEEDYAPLKEAFTAGYEYGMKRAEKIIDELSRFLKDKED